MTKEERKRRKELKHWSLEVKLIPKMIRIYCHGNKHERDNKKGLCKSCQELCDYSLYRLSKCPFKINKGFCAFCKIHCYKPDMKEDIKRVMRYSGPRMIFSHPIFALSHPIQMIKHKRKEKEKNKI